MGKFWTWFFGKPTEKLLEMRKEKQQKVDELLEEIKAIDEEVEKRNKEDKK